MRAAHMQHTLVGILKLPVKVVAEIAALALNDDFFRVRILACALDDLLDQARIADAVSIANNDRFQIHILRAGIVCRPNADGLAG